MTINYGENYDKIDEQSKILSRYTMTFLVLDPDKAMRRIEELFKLELTLAYLNGYDAKLNNMLNEVKEDKNGKI